MKFKRIDRFTGYILTLVLIALLTVAMMLLVISSSDQPQSAVLLNTPTAVVLPTGAAGTPQAPLVPPVAIPFISITGLVVLGGVLVLVVLAALVREAVLARKKTPHSDNRHRG